MPAGPSPGTLLVVATPLGNLEDSSPRALATLSRATLVACEDTRRTRGLLRRFGIDPPRIISCHKFSERRQAEPILQVLRDGGDVALVSDGGTPGVSDPGAIVVEAALLAGLPVSPIPGPSAVAASIAVSGFMASAFVFAGFLPSRSGARHRALETLRDETRPIVFYEAPHRVAAAVEAMSVVFGDRPVTLTREMTKMHEEVLRTTLAELARRLRESVPRGEFTLVVSGYDARTAAPPVRDVPRLRAQYETLLGEGLDPKQAIRTLVLRSGLTRCEVYAAVRGKG